MHLDFKLFGKGLIVNNRFKLKYPGKIWNNYADKEFFLDNVAYTNTVCSPLVSGIKKVAYNTSKPFIKKHIDESILNDIPSAVEDYKGDSTSQMTKKFKGIKYVFKSNKVKKPVFSAETEEKAVVPFSCGKDSLLTLAVCNEIGLDPVGVYFNDTVSPSENRLKIKYMKKIRRKLGINMEIVKDEIEKLNDFAFWGKEESVIGYSHLIFNFCLLSLPVNSFYKAKYLFLGNEYDIDAKLKNKDGVRCYPSYDQSSAGTKRLSKIFEKISGGKIKVASVINPLYDLFMLKILHGRYKEFGKYQISCACLDMSNGKRWCYNCADDASLFLYMKALGKDPRTIGINKNLFDKKYLKYHVVFNPAAKDRYDKVRDNDGELKFAYYLAYKNGAKGYVIDKFKEKYLDEVKANEDKLYKKYFKINNVSLIPKEIRKQVVSIYKEELA